MIFVGIFLLLELEEQEEVELTSVLHKQARMGMLKEECKSRKGVLVFLWQLMLEFIGRLIVFCWDKI